LKMIFFIQSPRQRLCRQQPPPLRREQPCYTNGANVPVWLRDFRQREKSSESLRNQFEPTDVLRSRNPLSKTFGRFCRCAPFSAARRCSTPETCCLCTTRRS